MRFHLQPGFCRRQERSKTACICLLIWFLFKPDEILGKIAYHAIIFATFSLRNVDKMSFTKSLSMTCPPQQNPKSRHIQRCDNVSHWNTNVKGKNKYKQRQKIICLNQFPQVYYLCNSWDQGDQTPTYYWIQLAALKETRHLKQHGFPFKVPSNAPMGRPL